MIGSHLAAPLVASPNELERLGEEIAELAAHLHAATYRLLVRLREFDEREGWGGGFLSCAHWLSWRTGIAPGAAREKVRVARALADLPKLGEAMERGELSFSKVRALTRIATPENEEELLELARHATAGQVEVIVRAWRRVDRVAEAEAERERHQARHLTLMVDDDGSFIIRGRLDAEVGALLSLALDAASHVLYVEGDARREGGASIGGENAAGAGLTGAAMRPMAAQRRADALGLLVELALGSEALRTEVRAGGSSASNPRTPDAQPRVQAGGSGNETGDDPASAARGTVVKSLRTRAARVQVVLHADADALRADSDSGQTVLAGGVRVSAETSRRLACDAGRVVMVHDASGRVLDVGRRTRTVPNAIRRALEHRDRGCRFPGCGNRFTDAHHVRHWADGGPTRLDNLLLLCRRHHRLVHEDGYSVSAGPADTFVFRRRDGRVIPEVPTLPPSRHKSPTNAGDLPAPILPARPARGAAPLPPYERLDLHWTIAMMYRPRGRETNSSA